MSNLKIDWVNHLIGFLTALIGIIIAFQLDDWQERKKEEEKLKITLQAIKAEIGNNMGIYKSDALALSTWLEHWDFIKSHDEDNNGEMIATEKEMNLMRAKHAPRFDKVKIIKKYRDSLNVYGSFIVYFDVTPKAGISTSSWEAAKSSDVLRSLDHARMTELTKIYDWINKDLGITDADVIRNLNAFDTEFGDSEKILHDYRMITKVYSFKLDEVDKHYQAIDWNRE